MPRLLLLFLALQAFGPAVQSQDSVSDSAISQAAYNNAVAFYHKYTDKQSRLYNGWLHIGYSNKITGVAYYPDINWQKGTVEYDGVSFPNVLMLYDVYKDELIIQHFHRLMLTLNSEKVKSFSFDNKKFIRIERDSVKKMTLNSGFYQELYAGKMTLLARRVKLLEETVTDQLEQKFVSKNYYYLNRNNTWYTVKGYKHLLSLLKERSKEIRQHLKKNKVKYRKEKERAITMAVQYFDSLTQ